MTPTLRYSQAFFRMAEILYRFLPGTGSPKWKRHISVLSIARESGLDQYWAGNKTQAISNLLENTYEYHKSQFQPLLIRIINEGIKHCQKDKNPVRREEIEELNGLILQLGFKFTELWDPEFLNSLEIDPSLKAKLNLQSEKNLDRVRITTENQHRRDVEYLMNQFLELNNMPDRQQAGRQLEVFLNQLFEIEGLDPRASFTISDNLEQIDGSFCLDNETYLVEAKWEKSQIGREPLYAFREVIEKTHIGRGVFIAINGCTQNALNALVYGKQLKFFILDGCHLMLVLQGQLSLNELLRIYVRKFAEEGLAYIPANKLTN